MEKHSVSPENAAKFKTWIADRGGIAIWRSINLSNPGASWSTPYLDLNGQPYGKPTWQAESTPSRIITDPADVVVDVPRLVKRFHVAIRRGSQGLSFKLTDASSDRVRRECTKAGETAWYAFDYETQDALIYVADRQVPLTEWSE